MAIAIFILSFIAFILALANTLMGNPTKIKWMPMIEDDPIANQTVKDWQTIPFVSISIHDL